MCLYVPRILATLPETPMAALCSPNRSARFGDPFVFVLFKLSVYAVEEDRTFQNIKHNLMIQLLIFHFRLSKVNEN